MLFIKPKEKKTKLFLQEIRLTSNLFFRTDNKLLGLIFIIGELKTWTYITKMHISHNLLKSDYNYMILRNYCLSLFSSVSWYE